MICLELGGKSNRRRKRNWMSYNWRRRRRICREKELDGHREAIINGREEGKMAQRLAMT